MPTMLVGTLMETIMNNGGVDGTLRKTKKIVDFKGLFCSSLYKNLLPLVLPRLGVQQTPSLNVRDLQRE